MPFLGIGKKKKAREEKADKRDKLVTYATVTFGELGLMVALYRAFK